MKLIKMCKMFKIILLWHIDMTVMKCKVSVALIALGDMLHSSLIFIQFIDYTLIGGGCQHLTLKHAKGLELTVLLMEMLSYLSCEFKLTNHLLFQSTYLIISHFYEPHHKK